MLTIVIDTNVFVSALIGRGVPLATIETTRSGQSRLLVSTPIVEEMQETLARPKFARHFAARETEPRLFIADYLSLARFVTPTPITDCPIEDPKDLKFIECAVGGKAEYIVSGDQHLIKLGTFRDIPILTPAQFLALLNPPADTSPDDTPRD